MAYLPPAGKRDFTEFKLSYLPTMSEIRNPGYTDKMLAKIRKPPKIMVKPSEIPGSNEKGEDWTFKPPHRYPTFEDFDYPLHPQCLGVSSTNRQDGVCPKVKVDCQKDQRDPRELPYGLPPISYDVRKRTDWFDHWREEHLKYAGALQLWTERYGDKYFYT